MAIVVTQEQFKTERAMLLRLYALASECSRTIFTVIHATDDTDIVDTDEDFATVSNRFVFCSTEIGIVHVLRHLEAHVVLDLRPPGTPSDLAKNFERVHDRRELEQGDTVNPALLLNILQQ
jgi:hypothetical protein